MKEADVKRFLRKVGKPDENGCAMYLGGWAGHGYGVFWCEGKQQPAHRIAWEIANGPIPDGLSVLHKCDNRWCVVIDHLFLGTMQDNVDDMRAKGRDSYGDNIGERNGQAILTKDEALQIYQMAWSGQYTQDEIGELFGVTRGCVKSIKLGNTWKHLWQRPKWSAPTITEYHHD